MMLAEAQMQITALALARHSIGQAHVIEQIDVHHDPGEGCFYANFWWLGMGADDHPSRIDLDLPAGLADAEAIRSALTQYPSGTTH